MTKHKVGFYYTEYGTAMVEASSAQEAEQKLHDMLAENGVPEDARINDRDYDATKIERE
jgi:hypothetical protein